MEEHNLLVLKILEGVFQKSVKIQLVLRESKIMYISN